MSHRWKCVVRTEFRDSVCFYLRHDTGEDPSTGEGYVPLTHVTFPLSPFPGHSRVVHLELEPLGCRLVACFSSMMLLVDSACYSCSCKLFPWAKYFVN